MIATNINEFIMFCAGLWMTFVDVVAFLVAPDRSWINGQILHANGGIQAHAPVSA